MSGFVFNGQALDADAGGYGGQSAEEDSDDSEEMRALYSQLGHHDHDHHHQQQQQQRQSGRNGGGLSLTELPRVDSADGPNGGLGRGTKRVADDPVADIDKMLSRPPPKLSHFVPDDLPTLTQERRKLRLQQYQPVAQPRQARARVHEEPQGRAGGELDTNLLNEAFAYVQKLTGTVNSAALKQAGGVRKGKKVRKGPAQGSAVRAARANSGRKGKSKKKGGKGPRKLDTQYGKGKSRVGGGRSKLGIKKALSLNQRVQERLTEEAFKKSGSSGPTAEMQSLISQFETGSEISKLRHQLEKANKSKNSSVEFIEAARREWLA